MHLKQLKLAGFKSFVDPTVVLFPSQLVCVVGPNGCGKSNIIDAFRWVLGESSAKNLRGESMADVIFNGSTNRKSLGQASVELVFDNSLGRMTGPFASYQEVSVRRVVTRDGESSYYLNGTRCRRRDITDIFLGTGAGARGYSIIGQGTISRMIEAKPEELRGYLEEAANVSKYKERRRETLQRIEQTRENLTRVNDIREELAKQLQRLERQAKAAERYTILKEEEQLCRAEILALKWKDLVKQQELKQKELQDLAVRYEQQQSLLTNATKDKTVFNEQLHEANEQSQQIQTTFYQLGTEIARLEESIQQQEREKKRLEQDKQQLQTDWQIVAEGLKQDQEELQTAQQQAVHLEQQLTQLKTEFKTKEELWQETQQQQALWQEGWQQLQSTLSSLKRELEVTELNIQHGEQQRTQTQLRLEKLQSEQQAVSLTDLQQALNELNEKELKLKKTQAFDEEQLNQASEALNQVRQQQKDTEEQLHQLQDEFYKLNAELAALNALQKAARSGKPNQTDISEWNDKPRLMDVLNIDRQWQSAGEMVLNEALHAYVLDSFEELWPQWKTCESQGQSVVTFRETTTTHLPYPRLTDHIKGKIPATVHDLGSIYTADSLEQAMTWLPELLAHESIITPNGFWLGQGWVKLKHPEEQDESGILVRQQKIIELTETVQTMGLRIEELRSLRDQYHSKLQEQQKYAELFQLNLHGSNEALRVNLNAMHAKEQAIEQAKLQQESKTVETQELNLLLEEITAQQMTWTAKLEQLKSQYQVADEKQAGLQHEKADWQETLSKQQAQLEEARIALHQVELTHDRELTKVQQLTNRIAREQERQDILQERLEQMAMRSAQSIDPVASLKEQLAEQLLRHSEIEQQLTASREQLSQFRMAVEDLEKKIYSFDQEVKKIQELISQTRMDEQALSLRASTFQESLAEFSLQAQTLLERIPAEVTQSQREDDLLKLLEKIKNLGAINLAAIEEYSTEQQRKVYLDDQFQDLSEALSTLENAIQKIDNETKQRLQNTFDEVNNSFKTLFPRLFGGGKAQLELTCENILEAGIVVMAQPPGKRNSTIHLLSGGEKAMTAVALVFAIFQLNPSPFCMLDEVDAPLDDVNVGRFCDLVKEMSQFVQFLFITHNKVTMELADHLIGVTMREPGVSRLVTVDVKQALTTE
ncbi:MAG: chromosome segregation protein SMC [Legionella sp.]|nr:MAG: chromosome segregation protein SMC [Legionella sp.]